MRTNCGILHTALDVERRRKSLYPVMRDFRNRGDRVRLVRDKLFVNGHLYAPDDDDDDASVDEEYMDARGVDADHINAPIDTRGATDHYLDAPLDLRSSANANIALPNGDISAASSGSANERMDSQTAPPPPNVG
ncbi:hypothetical protein FSP39_013485 [Pinctada imbricata]|uniref:Uncharacterized protein n=1 Tax=Pinctada imbricata TaxID=66713 RepID=A0AA88Y3N1_PINIB|nr:hypothetical protein FSP39_013485 [Pinctada imbricata]